MQSSNHNENKTIDTLMAMAHKSLGRDEAHRQRQIAQNLDLSSPPTSGNKDEADESALNSRQIDLVRKHPLAYELDSTGWVVLAGCSFCGNTVYLVSRFREIAKSFPHTDKGDDVQRAYHMAALHAKAHPESIHKPKFGVLQVKELFKRPPWEPIDQ